MVRDGFFGLIVGHLREKDMTRSAGEELAEVSSRILR